MGNGEYRLLPRKRHDFKALFDQGAGHYYYMVSLARIQYRMD